MDSTFTPVVGIFDDSDVFTKYDVEISFTELLVGGIPQNPEIIESWLRQRMLGGDMEMQIMMRRTLADLEIEVDDDASVEDMIAAAKKMASERNANTFRRNEHGLCLAAYNVKAMLKEATAILYPWYYAQAPSLDDGAPAPGDPDIEEAVEEAKKKLKGKKQVVHRWGPTGKAAKAFVAERVFVDEYMIPLGRREPDGTFMHAGHVDTPRGPRSTLSYHDFCTQPVIHFTLSSSEDYVTRDQWARILIQGQRLGMGAMRSLNHGQFRVTKLEKR